VDCSRHFNALFRIAGKYQGQWQEGKRHGYGIRTSAPFGLASHHRRKNLHASLSSLRSGENGNAAKLAEKAEEIRGGFVLTAKSDKLPVRRNSLTDKTGKKGFLMVSLKGDYFLISFTYFLIFPNRASRCANSAARAIWKSGAPLRPAAFAPPCPRPPGSAPDPSSPT